MRSLMSITAHRWLYLTGGLVGAALLGCRGIADPCSGTVNFQASPGTTPTFSWQPSCAVSSLIITSNPNQPGVMAAFVWGVQSTGDAPSIAPPVRFGIVPPGDQGNPNPRPLQSGASYRLSLYTHTSGGLDQLSAFLILRP